MTKQKSTSEEYLVQHHYIIADKQWKNIDETNE